MIKKKMTKVKMKVIKKDVKNNDNETVSRGIGDKTDKTDKTDKNDKRKSGIKRIKDFFVNPFRNKMPADPKE